MVSYLYKAAVAIGESEDFGWGLCAEWIRACCQGRVDDLTSDLDVWLRTQPPAPPEVTDDDAREIVRVALGHLTDATDRDVVAADASAGGIQAASRGTGRDETAVWGVARNAPLVKAGIQS